MFDLIKQLKSGALAPAVMQRPYVWSKQDVLDLFDSMMMQLPIGSICLWKPDDSVPLSSSRKTRMANIETFPDSADQLILDGQNRIATLAWALAGDLRSVNLEQVPQHEQQVWLDGAILSFDCSESRFFFAQISDLTSHQRLIVPVHVLLGCDSVRYFMSISERYSPEQMDVLSVQLNTFDDVQRKIMSSRIVVSTIFNASLDDAKRVFSRICKAGVPMSEHDFQGCMRS